LARFSATIVRNKTTMLFSLREKNRPPAERNGGAIEIGIAIGIGIDES